MPLLFRNHRLEPAIPRCLAIGALSVALIACHQRAGGEAQSGSPSVNPSHDAGAPRLAAARCVMPATVTEPSITADVLVYGATPSGIMASIEAARLGKQVVLLEPGEYVGGKFGGGIGIGEVKNLATVGGLARDFFQQVAAAYNFDNDGSVFEPHVAEHVIGAMLCGQPGIRVRTHGPLESVSKTGRRLTSVRVLGGASFTARQFIDASYEGDLLAAAGVSWTVGRESRGQYGESLNGVGPASPSYEVSFDPYRTPGDPASGVLAHIDATPPGAEGSADRRIMAYAYRVCLTARADNRVPLSPPPGYDPAEFEALIRLVDAKIAQGVPMSLDRLITLQKLPNDKFDVNNIKDLSTDYIGGSAEYPTASHERRAAIAAEHQRYIRAFLYFLQTSPRLPKAVHHQAAALGYCKDEYVDNGNFPTQLYVREARRMVGAKVMTQGDVLRRYNPQPIGLSAYYFDTHGVSLFALDGIAQAEGHFYFNIPYYEIPYSALLPKPDEASNLLSSICVSASHVAYSSLRVEPTYMIMGQSAGAAASLAIDQGRPVQDIDYPLLAQQLVKDGQILEPTFGAESARIAEQLFAEFYRVVIRPLKGRQSALPAPAIP